MRAVPCSPAEAAGGKEAAGLTSEREWKAATGAAKVGRWLASIPQPAPPRSAYVSFVPPVTLLEKLLLLRSVPAERVAIGKLTAGSWQSVTQPLDEGKVQTDADCPDAAGTMSCSRCCTVTGALHASPASYATLSLQHVAMWASLPAPTVNGASGLALVQHTMISSNSAQLFTLRCIRI